MPNKIAIVCFNLGGPDSTDAIQPFLFNLFNDKAIITLPNPFRFLLAKLISSKRAPTAAEIYGHIGGKSPIVELTREQTKALEASLDGEEDEYKAFISMRYWHPFASEAIRQVKEWGADQVILLPLYPQFSTTTTGSSVAQWKKEAKKAGLNASTSTIGCYPTEEHFVNSHVQLIQKSLESIGDKPYRILFSAHGLPEKIIEAGDPYQWQVEQTTAAVVEKLKPQLGDHFDYTICYQSRVGPLKWIGPSTEDEIKKAGDDKKAILLVPIAFVSEHSETLVELDIEYKELADEHGVKDYIRVPALGVEENYIKSLKQLILKSKNQNGTMCSTGNRVCPKRFTGCICDI